MPDFNPPAAEAEDGASLATAVQAASAEDGAVAPAREGTETGGWPDSTAEAAFLSEARDRGEVLVPVKAQEEIAEATDARHLPALDELVGRIPAEVRETLEDLFRARFVRVTRLPRKALER